MGEAACAKVKAFVDEAKTQANKTAGSGGGDEASDDDSWGNWTGGSLAGAMAQKPPGGPSMSVPQTPIPAKRMIPQTPAAFYQAPTPKGLPQSAKQMAPQTPAGPSHGPVPALPTPWFSVP